jgi:hypothetical protein
MEQVNRLLEPLKLESLDQIPALKVIKDKLNIQPSVLLLIVLLVLILLSPYLRTHALMTSIVCYLVPAYLSFLAL